MNRRKFVFNSAAVVGGGLVALSALPKAFAQEVPPVEPTPIDVPVCPEPNVPPKILTEISRNHGHDAVVSYEQVIRGEPVTISIKGESGHPHDLILTEVHFAALRKVDVIEVESTKVGGHTHIVKITRQPIPEKFA